MLEIKNKIKRERECAHGKNSFKSGTKYIFI